MSNVLTSNKPTNIIKVVKAKVNAGIVNLESILEITQGQCDKIKAYPLGVKNVLKDMHVEHFLSVTEDGIITSKMGQQAQGEFDPQTVVANLQNMHQKFLEWVDGLPEPGDDTAQTKEDADKDSANTADDNDNEQSIFGLFIIPMFV